MAYTVKTWEKKEIVIDNAAAEKVMAAIEGGATAVRIRGNLYKTAAIAQVTKGGQLPLDESKLIASSTRDRREEPGAGYERFQVMKRELLGSGDLLDGGAA